MSDVHRGERRGRSAGIWMAALVALACAGACRGCGQQPHRGRATPACAVQDCATGKIVDDGCADDGRCMSCVNPCPQPATVPTSPR